MTRIDLFHRLPGVWQEGDFYDTVWQQVRRQLKKGGDLNESERLVLLELLRRAAKSPDARKALGIRPKARTAKRNEDMAELYIKLHEVDGKSPNRARRAVEKAFPGVGPATVRAVTGSNQWIARARGRVLAAEMLAEGIKGPVAIKAP